MCLIHWMNSNAQRLGISVCAASFDHMLRGAESEADCRFVADWCAHCGVECITGSGNVRAYSHENGMSEEEAARVLRYEFLGHAAQELGCNVVATAHNANDNAETLLLNLTRGGGLKGLCGIPPRRGNIIRPLLSTTRAQIEEYNIVHGVEFVTDSTNVTDDYTRNVIRHHITPVLEGINPAFFEAVSRTAQSLREDERCLDDMARAAYDDFYKNSSFPAEKLLELPKPVAMRVLRMICGRGLSFENARSIYAIASGPHRRETDIPGMRVEYDRGTMYFGRERLSLGEYPLAPGTEISVPECAMTVKTEMVEKCPQIFKSFNIFYFKCDSICGSISLTSRKSGDRIKLYRRGCTKSLKDLFGEAKLDKAGRELTPVLRDDIGPVAVYGFGIAERCIASPGDRALRVTINKTNLTGDN